MFEQKIRDTSGISMFLFRAALFLAFLLMAGRLYQLQIVQGDSYRARADDNRFTLIEMPAPRGVIYDRSGEILTRNRPSFEIGVVPEDLPYNDPATEEDEEALEIARVLRLVGADTDEETALRIAELLFLRLGRVDYARTVGEAGVQLTYITVPGPVQLVIPEDGGPPREEAQPVLAPDISEPLPLPGLVALVQRAVAIGRQGSASQPVPILDLLDRDKAFAVAEEAYQLPSVRVEEVPVREYVTGDLMSHILGFMGPIPAAAAQDYRERGYTNPNEKVGLNGLEFTYQRELRGIPGYKNIEVDILGREMRTVGEVAEPVPGLNLILNIDRRLQQVMQDELEAMMEQQEAPWGVVVAMDPQTGAVLGMVSLPSYNNNIFAERIGEDYMELEADERRPLINYAIGGLYPPGSVFKMVPAAAALSEGVINRSTTIVDAGPIYLPNRYAPNNPELAQEFVSWNHKLGIVHGAINVVEALALSNDIFFYIIGGGYPPTQFQGLGQAKLSEWTARFGFGELTGVDLPGEVSAIVPNDQWKRQLYAESWTTGDSYNMAIGQGYVLATPLQVLVSTAAVANGGTIYRPQIVRQIVDASGGLQRDFEPIAVRDVGVDADLMELVQQGMWSAVNAPGGTAYGAKLDNVVVAGKTGTAEFCEYIPEEEDCRRDEKGFLPFHGWFVSYAPYDDPEIALAVFLYDGGEGSEVAVPVARGILEYYFSEISPR
ncbi:MAG: penicillin-binding protein 2 [Chloroflexota bacterium]|nr:penicillin-binding protein 2 [Chloroflexota bacterium]